MNFQIAPSVVEHLIECVSQSIRRGLTGKSHSKANVERSNTPPTYTPGRGFAESK